MDVHPRRVLASRALTLALLVAALSVAGCGKMRKEAITMVNEGVRCLNRGDGPSARSHFLRATQHDPEYASAHYHLGLVDAHYSEEPRTGIRHLEEALRLGPPDVETLFQLGRLKIETGNPEGGLTALERTLEMDWNHAPSWFYKGKAYAQLGRSADADRAWRECIAIQPHKARAFLELGELYETFEAFEQAFAVYEAGREHNPGNGDLINAVGVLATRLGETEKAVEAFSRALEIQGGRMDALYNLGFAYAESGLYEKAIASLQSYMVYADPQKDKVELEMARALQGALMVERKHKRAQ
jgi:tetratricopeptide (TPR) repeat protein